MTSSAVMLSSLLVVARIGLFIWFESVSISSESDLRNITERYSHEITDLKVLTHARKVRRPCFIQY